MKPAWKQYMLDGAEILDAYRVFPRVFVCAYIAGLARVLDWAIELPDISTQQAGFISVVSGTFPFVLNFYMQTGRQWQKEKLNEDVRLVTLDSSLMGQMGGVRTGGSGGDRPLRSSVPLRSKVQGGEAGDNRPQGTGDQAGRED